MTTGSLIRDWLKAEVEAVPGANKVHRTARVVRSADDLLVDFGTGITAPDGLERIRGWTIQMTERPTEEQVAGGAGRDVYTFSLACRWSVEDRGGTEADFCDHVEAVAAVLGAEKRPVEIPAVYAVGTPQIGPIDYREFGTRLCHFATVTLTVAVNRNIR